MEVSIEQEVLNYRNNPDEKKKWELIGRISKEPNRNELLETMVGQTEKRKLIEKRKTLLQVKKNTSQKSMKGIKLMNKKSNMFDNSRADTITDFKRILQDFEHDVDIIERKINNQ